jgi:UDPglucose--hexose-1-phosphate uridylyltransferase
MPELRQNFVTKEWVIISTERARRPSSYAEPSERRLSSDHPEYAPTCPFCPGNEELDLEVARIPDDGSPWQVRIVGNRFPALSGEGQPIHTVDGVQHRLAGVGLHDVIVTHPRHNTTLALMHPDEVRLVFEIMQQRGQSMARDPRIQQVIYFKNHGKRAGASLIHPHCQMIGMPVVPDTIRRRLIDMQRHFEQTGECAMCRMLEDELVREERIVVVSKHFVAFVLYAALSPFHIWIVPRQHRASYLQVPGHELSDLADVVQQVVSKIHVGLNNPDYNLIIRSAPVREAENLRFHWYISLVPRLSFTAGFEMGSGMHINPSLPEASADFLRETIVR